MITTALGLILIFLILSLLATAIQEFIAGGLSLRGTMLDEALQKLLTNEPLDEATDVAAKDLYEKFQKHNWYNTLRPKKKWHHYLWGGNVPSYINSSTFSTILVHVLGSGNDIQKLETAIGEMKDGKLKTFLQDNLEDTEKDIHKFKKRIEDWYDTTMDRASGWYKRKAHKMLLAIGFLIAIVFNADTLSIYHKLSDDPEARSQIINVAQQFINQGMGAAEDSINMDTPQKADLGALQNQIQTLISQDLRTVHSPLGIGWTKADTDSLRKAGFNEWAKKIFGLIVTALAISLGAPFWFDLLKQLMNIRTAGTAPKKKE